MSLASVHYDPSSKSGTEGAWVVKAGRKVLGRHFTFDAAAEHMRRDLENVQGVRFAKNVGQPYSRD